MEIFVDQRIVKTLALLYILQYLFGVHTKQVPIAHRLWLLKQGVWAKLLYHHNDPGPKFKGLGYFSSYIKMGKIRFFERT